MHTSMFHPGTIASPRNGLVSLVRRTAGLLTSALLAFAAPQTMHAQAPAFTPPPAVGSLQNTLASGVAAGKIVTDFCGNAYMNIGGSVEEIPAGSGKVVVLAQNTLSYNGPVALYIDRAGKFLYTTYPGTYYSSSITQIPITGCAPGTANSSFANNVPSTVDSYYYGTAGDLSGDNNGDVFFTTTGNGENYILEEVYSAATKSYTFNAPLSAWKNNISYITSDSAGNLYFNDGTNNVYYLPAPYTSQPVLFSTGYGKVIGLATDLSDNLYISDSSAVIPSSSGSSTTNGVVYEVPNIGGTRTAANQYAVAALGLPYGVSVDGQGSLYTSNYYPGAIQVKVSPITAPATTPSTTTSFQINYIFNAAGKSKVTPTGFSAVTDGAASSSFSTTTGGSCAAGTPELALQSCTVQVNFTPAAVGPQTASILIASSGGTISTNVTGVGLGASGTIDPGTVSTVASASTVPSAVATDALGNLYVTDTKANLLYEFGPGGSGGGTAVSTGSVTLSGPRGVAVDSTGDIFIADTGNNRVVEIPVVNGVLTNSSTAALALAVKAPEAVAVDANDNLYVADTGDNAVLFVPNTNGALDFSASRSIGTALSAPSALTLDYLGNLFVAEAGNNDVLEFAVPVGSSQTKLATGLGSPTALATDASGSLYVVDNGTGSVLRYPEIAGKFGASTNILPTVNDPIANPLGIASDALGNLYLTDTTDGLIAAITRTTGTLNFGVLEINSNLALTANVNNSGNQSVTFPTPSYVLAGTPGLGYSVTTDGCAGTTVPAGGSCQMTVTFAPTAVEKNATATVTMNGNGGSFAPVIDLTGGGANLQPTTVTVALQNPPNPLLAGSSVTFTAAVSTGTDTTPIGASTVSFFINGTPSGTKPVTNGVATLTLPSGLLAGSTTVAAHFNGDTYNYGPSTSPTITLTVVPLPDTLALTIGSTYTGPNSALDVTTNPTGPSIQLTATLTQGGSVLPNGTVTFSATNLNTGATTTLGVGSVVPNASGVYQVSLATTALRAGTTNVVENTSFATTYNISAVYSADTSYASSSATPQQVTISAPPTTQAPCATAGTCSTNTTGAFFTVSPTVISITAPTTTTPGLQSNSAQLSITSYGGWAGIVAFTCTGLPQYATCNPFPGTAVVAAGTATAAAAPTPVTLVVNTNVPPVVPTGSSMIWWMSGLSGAVLLLMRRRLQRMGMLRQSKLLLLLGAALLLAGSGAGLSGCSNSSTSGAITPAGTYTVTVQPYGSQYSYAVGGTQCSNNACPSGYALNDSNVPPLTLTLVVK